MHRAIARVLVALTLPTAIGLAAAEASETSTVDCWHPVYDADGDGYARASATTGQRTRLVLAGDRMTCPAPWVGVRGDCDDGDAAVHPRQHEVRDNGQDDDCDGRVDEPEMFSNPLGYDIAPDRFSMFVRLADGFSLATHADGALFYRVEYQRLDDTATSRFGPVRAVPWVYDLPEFAYTLVELTGLDAGTVYRARIQLYRRTVFGGRPSYQRMGDVSDWFRQMTTGDAMQTARADIVNRGLHEAWVDNNLGGVGYYGAAENGTRYGADLDEAWCSEFYSWVLTPHVNGIGHRASTSSIIDWYAGFGRALEVPAGMAERWMDDLAAPGDYLALDTNGDGAINHSAMFLAYDSATGDLITLDGNTNGRVDLDDTRSFSGANAASVRRRGIDALMTWGTLDIRMVR